MAALPDGDGRPNLPSRFDPGEVPLLTRMEEEASMAPYVEFGESPVNVAGSREMALVLLTSTLVITRIATDRAGDTIERLFWMVLDRPLVADMYRGGSAFRGDYQTCIVHVWRKAESLAIEHGIDSPEQTYSKMLPDTYYAAKEAAAAVTAMAGGPADSACQIGLPVRTVPGLADLVASARPGWPTTSPRWSRRTATWRSAIRRPASSPAPWRCCRASRHLPHPGNVLR